MDSQKVENKLDIFRAGSVEKPGRYYFVNTRKLVPNQLLKSGETNPEFSTSKYNVVPKPERRITRDTTDYSVIRREEPVVSKYINGNDILAIADSKGWRLSTKAQRALRAWHIGKEELIEFLQLQRERFPNENYIDYNAIDNTFLCRSKTLKK